MEGWGGAGREEQEKGEGGRGEMKYHRGRGEEGEERERQTGDSISWFSPQMPAI